MKRITTSWGEFSATWNNQPGYANLDLFNTVGPGPGYYIWDITSLVQAWRGSTPNYGLALFSPNEAITAYAGFASKEYGGPPPRLVIICEP